MKRPDLDRRQFLRLIGAGAAAGLASACGGSGDDAPAEGVIVIGAGVAGLTTANALTTAGIDTVVLEARDRVGGRVHTVEFAGAPVDLGGAWISGTEGNPAACVLAREGIGWQPAEPVDAGIAIFDAHRRSLLQFEELAEVAAAVFGFEEALPDFRSRLGANATFADAAEQYLAELELAGDARRRARALIEVSLEGAYAAGLEELALAGAGTSLPFPGGEHFADGGYRGLVAALSRGVDVRMGAVVSRVAHGANGVVVESSRGTFRGSHAVVTVPLGVLKQGSIEFHPALGAGRQSAIGRLGMGVLEKVVLRFDEPFWRRPGRSNLVYISETRGEFPFFADLTAYVGQPILACLYCGDFSRRAAQLDEQQLIERTGEIVNEIAGVDGIRPTEGRATRWQSDPFARGSYSYIPVGASLADVDALAQPETARLLFAGEATSSLYYGYVHGGVVSGAREATRLLGGAEPVLDSGVIASAGC